MSLHERAMLGSLHIGWYQGKITDRKVTKEVEEKYQARKAGRWEKTLIAKESIDKVAKKGRIIRTIFNTRTLPWSDGERIFSSKSYFELMQEVNNAIRDFDEESDNFCAVFDALKQEAKINLNGLYREDDYPDTETLRDKFYANFYVSPLPHEYDFRVDIPEDEIEKLIEQNKQLEQIRNQKALSDIWKRIHKTVSHIAETIPNGKEPGKYFDSLTGNVRDLVKILPQLNVFEDPDVNDIMKDLESKICPIHVDEIKSNSRKRKQLANEADEILKKMKGILG